MDILILILRYIWGRLAAMWGFVVDHWPEVLMVVFILLLVVLVIFGAIHTAKQKEACLKDGNKWEQVGTTVVYQQVGSTMVPNYIPKYGCIKGGD